MLSSEELKERISRNQYVFRDTMMGIRICAEMFEANERKNIYDFAIQLIGQELTASVALDGFRLGEVNNVDNTIPLPFSCIIGTEKDFSLQGINVVASPCDRNAFARAIVDVCKQGFNKNLGTYEVDYYPEIKLAVVTNGRHHLTVASLKNIAKADVQIFSLEKASEILTTDGGYWYLHDGEYEERIPVQDYRVALLYALYLKMCAV